MWYNNIGIYHIINKSVLALDYKFPQYNYYASQSYTVSYKDIIVNKIYIELYIYI